MDSKIQFDTNKNTINDIDNMELELKNYINNGNKNDIEQVTEINNIVNLNESVLKEVSDDVKVEVSDDVKVEVSDNVKVEVSDDVKVDDVMDLVDSLETETTKDLSELSEEELNNKTNKELKEYLKLKGLSNAGNKTKLIETILKLK